MWLAFPADNRTIWCFTSALALAQEVLWMKAWARILNYPRVAIRFQVEATGGFHPVLGTRGSRQPIQSSKLFNGSEPESRVRPSVPGQSSWAAALRIGSEVTTANRTRTIGSYSQTQEMACCFSFTGRVFWSQKVVRLQSRHSNDLQMEA